MSKLKVNLLPKKINKSSSDFWNSLKLAWQQCEDLPGKCYVNSVAVMDGKAYAAMVNPYKVTYRDPFVYDCSNDQWSTLSALPYAYFSLVTVPDSKQLLAIGGEMDNNGVIEISNKVFLWNEEKSKWTTPYSNMPTARSRCSSISHGPAVIVAGGVTCNFPWTMTRAVEVLHIKEHGLFTKSQWSVVEQLPHVVYEAIPLIVDNKLYITAGVDKKGGATTSNIITASLPELLQSSNKNTNSGQVWSKLADSPYASLSINHYQGHLITFGGYYNVEQPSINHPVYKSVPLIHIYNHNTNAWDHVGEVPYKYLLCRSVRVSDNKLLFIGGLTGTCYYRKDDDVLTTCSVLTLSPR